MELTIERLGLDGDGIARSLAGDVYVPFSLPGEVVRGDLTGDRMERAEIAVVSPDRVAPVCRHFGSCGGCALQHGSDDFLARWKTGTIERALAAQGLNAPMRPIVTSPPFSRSRVTFAGRRTKKTVQAGFHARQSDVIVPLSECPLIAPELLAAVPVAAKLTAIGASRSAAIRVAVALADNGLDVAVSGAKPLEPGLIGRIAGVVQAHDLTRLSWNGELAAQQRPPERRFGKATAALPPGAFGQATRQGEAALVAAVREIAGGAGRVADLFSGCGTFALPLAERAEVHAVEAEAAMLQALDGGWRKAAGLQRVSTETRDLFSRPLLAAELNRFDCVVLDPPRAGALAQCIQIAASGSERVAYVSCNPVSFARDAKVLAGSGFEIGWVRPVDQFRWSGHVELVASFSRAGSRS